MRELLVEARIAFLSPHAAIHQGLEKLVYIPELLSDIWNRPVVRPPTCPSSSLPELEASELSESESLPAAQNLFDIP